jgi:hypothetical protein
VAIYFPNTGTPPFWITLEQGKVANRPAVSASGTARPASGRSGGRTTTADTSTEAQVRERFSWSEA